MLDCPKEIESCFLFWAKGSDVQYARVNLILKSVMGRDALDATLFRKTPGGADAPGRFGIAAWQAASPLASSRAFQTLDVKQNYGQNWRLLAQMRLLDNVTVYMYKCM